MKSFLKGCELLLDADLEPPLDVKVDVLLFVLVGDWNVLPVGQQVVAGDLTEPVVFYAERAVEYIGDVIVSV